MVYNVGITISPINLTDLTVTNLNLPDIPAKTLEDFTVSGDVLTGSLTYTLKTSVFKIESTGFVTQELTAQELENNPSVILTPSYEISKIVNNGNTYKIKDSYAREQIETLAPIAKLGNVAQLLKYEYFDHIINDQSWLEADTFSWQDGTVYSDVYNHLVNDYNNILPISYIKVSNAGLTKFYRDESSDSSIGTHKYAWTPPSSSISMLPTIYTDTQNVEVGTFTYEYPTIVGSYGTISEVGSEDPRTETIGSYTITYYQAQDGHKICFSDQETTVANIYNESGVAWYYVLDTTNQRFKLPRSSHGNIIEKYTNKKNWYRVYSDGWCEQGGFVDTTETPTTVTLFKSYTSTNYHIDITSAYNGNGYPATTNGVIRVGYFEVRTPNANVDFYWKTSGYTTTKLSNPQYKYLYFYVGQYTQTATEQTAGLNAELFNGKADRDLNNVSSNIDYVVESYKNGSDWYRIYKSGWCEQGGYMARAAATTNVTYLKEFIDTNYNLQMSVRHTAAGTDGRPPLINSPTTTGFTASINTAYEGFYWKACGYIVT